MHADINEEKLLKKMLMLREEDDLHQAERALTSMIFFLSTAKNIAAEPNSKYKDFTDWFDNSGYQFFSEVEALKEILTEYKNMPKP